MNAIVCKQEQATYEAAVAKDIANFCLANAISAFLDISNLSKSLISCLRQAGYGGLIITINPDPKYRQELLEACLPDWNWIVLPSGTSVSSTVSDYDRTKGVLLNLRSHLCQQLHQRIGAIHVDLPHVNEEIFQGLLSVFPNLGLIACSCDSKDAIETAPKIEIPGFTSDFYRGDQKFHRGSVNYRRMEPATQVEKNRIDVAAVVTSIGGRYNRPDIRGQNWGENWFRSCFTSWKSFAPECYTIAEVPPPIAEMSWIVTKHKPRIVEIFQNVPQLSGSHIILTNADVLLAEGLKKHLPLLDPDVFYFGKRMDVIIDPEDPTALLSKGYYYWGYDVFIVPIWAIARLNKEKTIPAFLKYGEPYWDWGLPLAMMLSGVPAKRLEIDPPAILHLDHGRESNRWWKEQGLQFLKWCHELDQLPVCAAKSVVGKVAAHRKLAKSRPDIHLVAASQIFMDWLG